MQGKYPLTIVLVVLWLPLPLSAESICYDSLDCPPDQVCDPQEHECVYTCTSLEDCAPEENCIDGFCRGAEVAEEDTSCGCGHMATTSRSLCVSNADCYCRLVSKGCDILVSAEVLTRESYVISIKILEPPHHDPYGHLEGVPELTQLEWRDANPKVGDRGLVKLNLTQPCGQAGTHMELATMVPEINGIFPCESDLHFEGISKEEVLSAVLVDDDEDVDSCREKVHAMGLKEGQCGTIDEGCCYQSIASLSNSLVLLLVAGSVLVRRMTRG